VCQVLLVFLVKQEDLERLERKAPLVHLDPKADPE